MKAKKTVIRTYYKNHTQIFNTSDSFQSFTVPVGITKLQVDCVASKGADSVRTGANGGRVQCTLPVTPNQTLYIMVGGIPSAPSKASYNASDIRTNNDGITNTTSLNSRLVVAGAGGSGSNSTSSDYWAGAGGGLTGQNANQDQGGHGGTQTGGGRGGTESGSGGASGTLGLGGNGGVQSSGIGGAGGAGYYGGGGGRAYFLFNNYSGSGAGGSSYTDPTCFNVVHTQGYNAGEGYITITYAVESTESDYDFYRDFYEVKVVKKTINNEDKFYGVKEYKRGQYYGN